MKTARIASLFAVLAASAALAQEVRDDLPAAPHGKTWKLAWHDEFDGPKLDESKWVYRPGGVRKDGWWNKKAVTLDGKGHLVIKTYIEKTRLPDEFLVDYVRVYDLVESR